MHFYNSNLQKAILLTISYSDMFDYPMSEREIVDFLITSKPVATSEIRAQLKSMKRKTIFYKNGYYCLLGRDHIIPLRKHRESISVSKWHKVNEIVRIFQKMPTVKYIAVSGSLAKNNADEDADIDLFIITATGTLWFTRLILLCILQIIGKRRRYGTRTAPNSICLNFWIDETCVALSHNRQEIYTAFEIAQMRTVFDSGGMYSNIFFQNRWLTQFLGNMQQHSYIEIKKSTLHQTIANIVSLIEPYCRFLQHFVMRKHITKETVKKHIAAFHPYDYRTILLHRFEFRKKIVEKNFLWVIDKQNSILYTRNDSQSLPSLIDSGEIFYNYGR